MLYLVDLPADILRHILLQMTRPRLAPWSTVTRRFAYITHLESFADIAMSVVAATKTCKVQRVAASHLAQFAESASTSADSN